MSDQEYADLRNRALAILKQVKEFPAHEFMTEADRRFPAKHGYLRDGDAWLGAHMCMWSLYCDAD